MSVFYASHYIPKHQAKWVQLNGKTLQVLKRSWYNTAQKNTKYGCGFWTEQRTQGAWSTVTLNDKMLRLQLPNEILKLQLKNATSYGIDNKKKYWRLAFAG